MSDASHVSELFKQLPEHRRQLAEINLALRSTPNDPELLKLAADLQEVISTTEDLAKTLSTAAINKSLSSASATQSLSSVSSQAPTSLWQVGQRVMALWEDDNEYYVAQIDGITDSGGYIVTYLDYGTTSEITSNELRPYSPAAADSLRPGTPIRAVYSGSGLFYDAFIQGFDQATQTYLVKFVRYIFQSTISSVTNQLRRASTRR